MRIISLLAVLFFAAIPLSVTALYTDPASTSSSCDINSKPICYHSFDNTHTTTTADSDVYDVSKCDFMSYKFDGDGGTARIFIKECSSLDSSGDCVAGDTTIFTEDMDGDGRVTLTDEGITLNGEVGRRIISMVAPAAKWHFVDVQYVPASTTVHASIQCHKL